MNWNDLKHDVDNVAAELERKLSRIYKWKLDNKIYNFLIEGKPRKIFENKYGIKFFVEILRGKTYEDDSILIDYGIDDGDRRYPSDYEDINQLIKEVLEEVETDETEIPPGGMKVRFIAEGNTDSFIRGKAYNVISIEKGWYRILPEDEDEDYLFPPEYFEIIEE